MEPNEIIITALVIIVAITAIAGTAIMILF
jgi:hypothetical protein